MNSDCEHAMNKTNEVEIVEISDILRLSKSWKTPEKQNSESFMYLRN